MSDSNELDAEVIDSISSSLNHKTNSVNSRQSLPKELHHEHILLHCSPTRRKSGTSSFSGRSRISHRNNESSPSSEIMRHYVHSRKVTRDIAALDFLQNIPMLAEQVEEEARQASSEFRRKDNTAEKMSEDSVNSSPKNLESSAGRRLRGYVTTTICIPALFRYYITTKYPSFSAVVRRWEGLTTQQGLLDSRMFFSGGHGYPVAASTVLKYNGNSTSTMRKRIQSLGHVEDLGYDWRGKSYFRLLHATWTKCDPDRDAQDAHPISHSYMPNYLDDPEFRQGRHRHVVRGDKNIGPVVSSILLFVKPGELQEELNKKFREKHTWLTSDLSLSKIRNLKREALIICQRLDLEVATTALACVLFEKLILNYFVTKENRKLYMSVCFVLAAKFNQPQAGRELKRIIRRLLIEIDRVFSIPFREVLTKEFTIYAQLSFNLHVPLRELQSHFIRLLKCMESNPRKYLDEDVFTRYSNLIMQEKASGAIEAGGIFNVASGSATSNRSHSMSSSGDIHQEQEENKNRSIASPNIDRKVPDIAGRRLKEDGIRRNAIFSWHSVSFRQWWQQK